TRPLGSASASSCKAKLRLLQRFLPEESAPKTIHPCLVNFVDRRQHKLYFLRKQNTPITYFQQAPQRSPKWQPATAALLTVLFPLIGSSPSYLARMQVTEHPCPCLAQVRRLPAAR